MKTFGNSIIQRSSVKLCSLKLYTKNENPVTIFEHFLPGVEISSSGMFYN